ncbi:MAG: S9 family peptidase [archaeon]|nr:S9 family peptidase [archaeon]
MQKRPIQPEDLFKYRTISRPDFSPDGQAIAISVHQANKEENLYNSDIATVNSDGSGVTRFTYGGKDSSPRFSPDGKSVLFLSRRTMEKEEKGNELYLMSLPSGQPRRLLKRKEGIEGATWSPDSKVIYFLSKVLDEGEDKGEKEKDKDAEKVVKGMRLWFNGEGFVHNVRMHLFSINVASGNLTQLTSGDFDVGTFHPSNSGKNVAYLASTDDMKPYIADLFVLDVNSARERPAEKVTKSDMELSDFAWSPDDRQIALNGNYHLPKGFASNSHVFIVEPRENSDISRIESIDLSKANSLNSDCRQAPHGSAAIYWRGDFVYYLQAEGGSVRLYKTKPGMEPELLLGGDRSIEDYTVSQDGKVAFVSMDSSHLQELRVLEGRDERQLTNFNDNVYQELEIVPPEHFSFKASDGASIDAWVIAKDKTKKNPTIVYIHGGPKTAFGNSYMHEFQIFASKGYAVLYANIRGSDGYSEDFADIRGHYGERDFQDVLELVERASQTFRFIDKERLGIAGGSYGGFMTNWAVGHTEIFKAAVTDRSIASWESFFGTSDIGPYFTIDQIGSDPFAARSQLEKMSPITYATKIKTPVLIIHSTEDYRCWMVEGLQLYTALKYLGKEVEMVLFPEENHDLSRVGKPKHRIARANHYLRWFDKYLMQETQPKSQISTAPTLAEPRKT